MTSQPTKMPSAQMGLGWFFYTADSQGGGNSRTTGQSILSNGGYSCRIAPPSPLPCQIVGETHSQRLQKFQVLR